MTYYVWHDSHIQYLRVHKIFVSHGAQNIRASWHTEWVMSIASRELVMTRGILMAICVSHGTHNASCAYHDLWVCVSHDSRSLASHGTHMAHSVCHDSHILPSVFRVSWTALLRRHNSSCVYHDSRVCAYHDSWLTHIMHGTHNASCGYHDSWQYSAMTSALEAIDMTHSVCHDARIFCVFWILVNHGTHMVHTWRMMCAMTHTYYVWRWFMYVCMARLMRLACIEKIDMLRLIEMCAMTHTCYVWQ